MQGDRHASTHARLYHRRCSSMSRKYCAEFDVCSSTPNGCHRWRMNLLPLSSVPESLMKAWGYLRDTLWFNGTCSLLPRAAQASESEPGERKATAPGLRGRDQGARQGNSSKNLL